MSRVNLNLQDLRRIAIANTLFAPTTLAKALHRLGFVQADPIRSPARAQDLILRHRVLGYVVGELDSQYPNLELEEDILYAYGFLHRSVQKHIYPKPVAELNELEQQVHNLLLQAKTLHPKQLVEIFGNERSTNAWGGYSRTTKLALEKLHSAGYARIAHRTNSTRVYQRQSSPSHQMTPQQRLAKIVMTMASLLAPVRRQIVCSSLRHYSFLGSVDETLQALIHKGDLVTAHLNGIEYLLPPNLFAQEVDQHQVRILAPFDPLVWDRTRFEQFWGWPYRFEAYVPASKRTMGYYAMPVLWGEQVIGWANARVNNHELVLQLGFVGDEPRNTKFKDALNLEAEQLRGFLGADSARIE